MIEDCLEGTGLECSPNKSKVLLYLPIRNCRTKDQRDHEKIKIRDGTTIPIVNKIRVLGMTIEALGRNGDTIP